MSLLPGIALGIAIIMAVLVLLGCIYNDNRNQDDE
jgi:hypothetical protein